MSIKPLYEFDDERRQRIVKMHLEMPRGGEVTGPIEGAYGEIYSVLLNDFGPHAGGCEVASDKAVRKSRESPERR